MHSFPARRPSTACASPIAALLDGDKISNFSNRSELLILYMSDGELTSLAEERLVSLTTCEALIWLNRVMKSGLFGIDSLGRGPLMGPACVKTPGNDMIPR
jgi:hypothetical protein